MARKRVPGPGPKGDQSGIGNLTGAPDAARNPVDPGAAILDTTSDKFIATKVDRAEKELAAARAAAQQDSANAAAEAGIAAMSPTRAPGGDPDMQPQVTVVEVKQGEYACGPQAIANMLNERLNAAPAMSDDCEKKLVDFTQACFDMSYDKISKRYDYWSEAEQTHDLYVPTSVVERTKRGNRTGRTRPRIIDTIRTPYSRAISDVTATYMLSIFGGSPPFKIEPERGGSIKGAKIIEAELGYNMRRAGFEKHIYQIALDQNRYGMSPLAIYYGAKGNLPLNVDPWDYFPDPRVGAQNRDEADFCGLRSTASLTALRRRGLYARLDKLSIGDDPNFSWECNKQVRSRIRGQSVDPSDPTHTDKNRPEYKLGRARLLNTLFVFFDPMEIAGIPAPFGLYRITVADEKTIILFDRCPWPHGYIPIVHGEADYDAHKTFGSSGYDLMMPLQRFQDWLIRSRVENIQSIIQSRLIIDPNRIHMGDILEPNAARMVRTLPGVSPKDAILPIDVPDATKGFWNELDTAGQLMSRLMAANDTAQGVQTDTERTATEIARLTSLGQQRLGTKARLISATMMRRAASMMISNLQYFGVAGGQVKLPLEYAGTSDGWYQWQQHEILGEYDYVVTDGTLPVDPRNNPENLLRAMRVLSETGMFAQWNGSKFVEQFLMMIGFTDIDTWRLTQEQSAEQRQKMGRQLLEQNPGAQAQLAQAAGQMTNQVQSDEKVMNDVQRGNVIPLAEAAREVALSQSAAPMRN